MVLRVLDFFPADFFFAPTPRDFLDWGDLETRFVFALVADFFGGELLEVVFFAAVFFRADFLRVLDFADLRLADFFVAVCFFAAGFLDADVFLIGFFFLDNFVAAPFDEPEVLAFDVFLADFFGLFFFPVAFFRAPDDLPSPKTLSQLFQNSGVAPVRTIGPLIRIAPC